MTILGTVYKVQPVAPDPEHTVWLDAGSLRIGVEHRAVDPEALREYYDGENLEAIEEHSPEGGFTDQGLSIHVESVEDAHEYLRFDVFDDEPHYHYVDKRAGTNTLVGFDRVAHGEMLPWVLEHLGDRLAPMLTAAGAAHVAAGLPADAGSRVVMQLRAHLVDIGVLEGRS